MGPVAWDAKEVGRARGAETRAAGLGWVVELVHGLSGAVLPGAGKLACDDLP